MGLVYWGITVFYILNVHMYQGLCAESGYTKKLCIVSCSKAGKKSLIFMPGLWSFCISIM